MPDLSQSEIAAIRARCEKATKGPWRLEWLPISQSVSIRASRRDGPAVVGSSGFADEDVSALQHKANADFIAHAREDVPKLFSALEAAERKNAELEALAKVVVCYYCGLRVEFALKDERFSDEGRKRLFTHLLECPDRPERVLIADLQRVEAQLADSRRNAAILDAERVEANVKVRALEADRDELQAKRAHDDLGITQLCAKVDHLESALSAAQQERDTLEVETARLSRENMRLTGDWRNVVKLLQAEVSRRQAVERDFREHLWVNHGCSVATLYGDDGEMQCGLCVLDFKRMPLSELRRRLLEKRLAALAPAGEGKE